MVDRKIKNLKILMIAPLFPESFWSFKYLLKLIRKKAAFPPLGLLTVAAMLPSHWVKKLIDVNVEKLTNKDILWADYVFIGAMLVQQKAADEIIKRCKKLNRKIVAGGPLFTMEFKEYIDVVDHFVLNEAEITLPLFLKDLKMGTPDKIYQSNLFSDIKKTPVPLWELINLKKYASTSIQFSRGCPFFCDFCNVTTLFGRKIRQKTTDQIIAELDIIYERGHRDSVFFVDDNFIGSTVSLKKSLLPALIKWKENHKSISFYTETSINIADDEELMKQMNLAGFDQVFIGIETPSCLGLEESNKKQNRNRDLVSDIKKIQRNGIQVQAGFIVGFDSDTNSIFQQQIDFIQKSGIVTAMVGLLQAPPGTKLYDRLNLSNRLKKYISGDNSDGTTNIIPLTMNSDTLTDGYKHILKKIYSPKNYYKRIKTFLNEYKYESSKEGLSFSRFLIFLRSTFYLGIIGNERYYYWKLLIWTFITRPKHFSMAVHLSILGFNFRKAVKKVVAKC